MAMIMLVSCSSDSDRRQGRGGERRTLRLRAGRCETGLSWGLLGQKVAGGQGFTADVDGVLPPDAERLVAAADEGLGSPQHEDRAFDFRPAEKVSSS